MSRYWLSLIALIVTCSSAVFADTQPATPVLKAGIEHVETLPAVDPRLAVGATYDQKSFPQKQPGNDWYWIPDWFAGHWHSDKAITLATYDLKTGTKQKLRSEHQSISDEVRGFQRDSHGIVWQYKSAPYVREVQQDGMLQVQFVKVNEPVEVGMDRVVARYVGTTVEVDPRTKKITRVWQSESIQEYYPIDAVEVRCNSSVKIFGSDGKPVSMEKVAKASVRTMPFTPIDIYHGKDLRPMFRDFLTAIGHSDLVPMYTQPPTAFP